jgi:tetratricopeptide (TPR) repeat protein/DNA-binding CsgD family transcriptional regulator
MNTELIRLERMAQRAKNAEERCEALCRLAEAFRRYDPVRAPALAEEALAIARQKGYRRGEAYALAILGPLAIQHSAESNGLEYLEQAQRIAEEIDDEEVLCKALLGRSYAHLRKREIDESLRCVDRALEIARSVGDSDAESDALLLLVQVYGQQEEWPRAQSALRRAERVIGKSDTEPRRAMLLLYSGRLFTAGAEFAKAIATLNAALDLARQTGHRIVECSALLMLGQAHGSIGDYPAALRHLLHCSEAAEKINQIQMVLESLLNIAVIHKQFGDFERAEKVAERVLLLAREHCQRNIEASALNNLGNLAYNQGILDTALGYFRACATIAEEHKLQGLLGISRENIGNVLRDQQFYDEALEYYQSGMAIAEKLRDRYALATLPFNIGLLHLDRLEHSHAIEMLALALERAEQIELTPQMQKIHGNLALAYEQRGDDGDIALALAHLKKAVELHEQLKSAERQRHISEMETRAAIERAEREREQERARSERLALEAQHRVEELNALGVHLAERSELIALIAADLHRALEADQNEREEILHTMVKTVAERGKIEGEWSGFEEKLQLVHHGVLVELARWNPDLKPAELKICALLRTQLSTKEIATLLSVSERAVEKHRYRIRRKLGLSKEENLVAFLARIGNSAIMPMAAAA